MPHEYTVACVEKAESLIHERSVDAFRYATLQLRMGIEYLFYEIVPLYRGELPGNVLSQWRPQQILDAILDCDPDADVDTAIAFVPSGTLPRQDDFMISKSANKKLLGDYYHKLGSYLHAPKDLKSPSLDKWGDLLSKTSDALKQYSPGQILQNMGEFIEISCECGYKIRRREEAILRKKTLQCFNPDCGMLHEDIQILDGKISSRPRSLTYICKECQTEQHVPHHKLKDGVKVTCCNCRRKSVAVAGFWID